VSKVTVFRSDEDTEMKEPTIVYYVENALATWQKRGNSAQNPEDNAGRERYHTRRDDHHAKEVPYERRQSVGPSFSALRPRVNSSSAHSPSTVGDTVTIAAKPKLDDATLWNTCKCRGERISQASMQNKDTAMRLVTPIDSPWEGTMEEELKLWGYKQPKGATLYCDYSNTEMEFKAMGIDKNFIERTKDGQNRCYQALHSKGRPYGQSQEQMYEVEGKTYRVSEGPRSLEVTNLANPDD
jgi:hypothetical protein